MAGRLQDVILRGTRAAQPLATTVASGTLYYVTDEGKTERASDTTSGLGASWETYNDSGATTRAITFVIDGGSSVIAAGTYAPIYIPYACTIVAVTLLSNAAGSVVIDLKKAAYASYPTGVSIVASAPPTLTATDHNQDTTLTGWTTTVAAGSFITPSLASPSTTLTRVSITLTVTV